MGTERPLVGLGGADDDFAVHFGDRLDDLESASQEIDPAHGQRDELAPPEAGVGQDPDDRVLRLAGLGEVLKLITERAADRSEPK